MARNPFDFKYRQTFIRGDIKISVRATGNRQLDRAVNRAKIRVAKRQGGWVRTLAKRSIKSGMQGRGKNRKYVPSKPGEPPKNKTGTLKKFILWAYDQQNGRVIIGPKKLSRRIKGQPAALEKGGTSQVNLRRRGRGRAGSRLVRYRLRPRPYMRRALKNSLPKLADFWRDSVRKIR